MKYKFILAFLFSQIFFVNIFSSSYNHYAVQDSIFQKKAKNIVRVTDFFNMIVSKDKDKVSRDKNGLLHVTLDYVPFDYHTNFSDTIIIEPYFLPVVFDGKILPEKLDFLESNILEKDVPDITLIDKKNIVGFDHPFSNLKKNNEDYFLINEEETMSKYQKKNKEISMIRRDYFTSNPEKIKYKSQDLVYDIPVNVTDVYKKNPFQDLITADVSTISAPSVETKKIKQRYWKFNGSNNLNIAQRHFTDNWKNQGSGVSQISSQQRIEFLYRKNKIEFSQWTEWRLDITRMSLSREDKENDKSTIILNEDYVRAYNKLAMDAFIKKWSYIVTVDMKTPIFNKFDKDNKKKLITSFLSPFDVNIGIGASLSSEWKSNTNPNRNSRFVLDASPLSMQIIHIKNDKVWQNNNQGVVYPSRPEERRYTKTSFGITMIGTFDYKINGYTSFYSRNKFFSDYQRTLFECENTLNFRLNRFLTAKLYYYLVFDDIDPSKKDPTWKYFSFTDEIRFGASYSW